MYFRPNIDELIWLEPKVAFNKFIYHFLNELFLLKASYDDLLLFLTLIFYFQSLMFYYQLVVQSEQF
jgi:hypothetical protein